MVWAPITVDLTALEQIRRPLRFAECFGTVGGFAVGGTLAGMRLSARIDGAAPRLHEASRALLGSGWEEHVFPLHRADPPADVVVGSVPYRSGPGQEHREISDMVGYAGRVKAAAVVVHAPLDLWTHSDGHGLIQVMREALERKTVCKYRIAFVLVDDLSCGGVVYGAPQCFAVLSQAPFGVERPDVGWLPTVWDAVGDLSDSALAWDRREIALPPTWWSASLRTPAHDVDGHAVPDPYGNIVRTVAPYLPFRGFARGDGIRWTKHPVHDRHLTHREAARLMGFPDSWHLLGMEGTPELGGMWGTGPTVAAARWLLHWLDRSLHGEPGAGTGSALKQDGRWTYAVEVTESLGWWRQADRQWGPDWRDRL